MTESVVAKQAMDVGAKDESIVCDSAVRLSARYPLTFDFGKRPGVLRIDSFAQMNLIALEIASIHRLRAQGPAMQTSLNKPRDFAGSKNRLDRQPVQARYRAWSPGVLHSGGVIDR